MTAPTLDDMPRRNLPVSISEEAIGTVACALFADDMASAMENGRLVDGHQSPTMVHSSRVTVREKSYRMTVTVSMSREPS